jgi:hypothetical protein
MSHSCWTPGDALEIFSGSESASIQIGDESQPKSVKWNNRSVAVRFDGQSNLVSLHF